MRAGASRGARRAAVLALLAAPWLAPAQPVGEKPTAPTAEQVALRDQRVLLPRNQLVMELALAYARAERDFGVIQLEQRVAAAELAARYGLLDDLQLSARLPWRYRRATSSGEGGAARDEGHSFGDLSLGLFRVALHEGPGRPNLIVGLDGVVPVGAGDAAVGAGVSATRSYDPVILFAGVSYLYGLRTDVADPDRSLAQHNVGFNLGCAFAVNDSVALTGQLIGSVRNFATLASGFRPPREQYRLQLGVTWLLQRGLFLEPTVAVAVGGAAPDLTVGVNVPFTLR